jgi:ABC-2 type transport system permease protein
MLLSFILTYDYFLIDAYNWWYTLILPGILTLCCVMVSQKDGAMKNTAILSLPVELQKVWLGKVLVCTKNLTVSCMIIFIGTCIGNSIFHHSLIDITPVVGVSAISLIIITFMWQIPVCLFLGYKFGLFQMFLLNTALNFVGAVVFSISNLWWICPYAYAGRLMCPVLKILPNGLLAEPGSMTFKPELLSNNVILPACIISITLYVIFSVVTAKWFENQEAQ